MKDLLQRLDALWIALHRRWPELGILALFDTNVVAEIFGTGTAADVMYVLVGFAALMFVARLLVARLLEGMHLTGRHTHPRGG